MYLDGFQCSFPLLLLSSSGIISTDASIKLSIRIYADYRDKFYDRQYFFSFPSNIFEAMQQELRGKKKSLNNIYDILNAF